MAESLFSPYWYRAEKLHPRLISTTVVTRQVFRGEQWYVLSNQATGRQFRVNSLGYQIVGRLDGRRTVQEMWDLLVRELGAEAPSQDEVLSVLSELTAAGMLHSENTADIAGIFDAAQRRRERRGGNKLNPLAFRVPLFDPTPLLDVLAPLARPLFNAWTFALWLLVGSLAGLGACLHWDALSAYADVHLLTARNLVLMWLCYPLIKAAHELGHALAIRVWRGEVHEVGISLFLLVPVPYVDASAASAFPEKRRRILVSAMGVMVETGIAAIAFALWLAVDDGLLRDTAFAFMVIGGASTVLVNANPLMRFDGYYVLSDCLEMPGLATRADAYLRYVGERYLLGNKHLVRPSGMEQTRAQLLAYGLASLGYRLVLFCAMVAWLAAKHIVAGGVLAVYLVLRFVLQPSWRLAQLVFRSPRLSAVRGRAVGSFVAALAIALSALFIVPLPHTTHTEGVVWPLDEARVRNETEGFVARVLASDGQAMEAGQPLLVLENMELAAHREQLVAQLASRQTAYQSALLTQPAQAIAIGEDLDRLAAQIADTERKLEQLVVVSPLKGTLSMPRPEDMTGRYFERGSVVAHVLTPERLSVRAVLPQTDVDLLRDAPKVIEVRLAESLERSLTAKMRNQTPAATNELPSAALGDRAGGTLVTDPSDSNGLRTLDSFFIVDLQVLGQPLERIGSRVWVRISHGHATLAEQWARRLRQLFVKQFQAPAAPAYAAP